MSHPAATYATLDEWIAREAIPFSLNSPGAFNAAVDTVIAALGDAVQLLGLGEALHGGEEILILRNRLFQRLVEAHSYSAIAIESTFPRAHIVNDYMAGRGPASYEEVQDTGFGSAFGRLEANRELVEWMRAYNAGAPHGATLQFYGFDIPSGSVGIGSPRHVLQFVLDYLASLDVPGSAERRIQIVDLLGDDALWESPAAHMDPTQSIGLSPQANALRIATEDLISELQIRRPHLVQRGSERRYLEALQYARVARQLLNFHAAMARGGDYAERLGVRDVLMAENLAYVVRRERGWGKVLAFAHNSHLRRGRAEWQLGADLVTWWPAGAQLAQMLGARYAVIGTAVGVSDENGIGEPEAGTLEALLTATPGPARVIPTHDEEGMSPAALAALPVRSGSTKNPTYFPLTSQSLTDFDWLAVLDSTIYNRGGFPLQAWTGEPEP